MKITTQVVELKILTASDGMVLTNGEAYGKVIYLGKNDSAENWHEITEEEYEEILQEEYDKSINIEDNQ